MKTSVMFQVFGAAALIAMAVGSFLAPKVATTPPQTAIVATATRPEPQAETRALYGSAAALKREADGHYWALASLDGQYIKLMVDTGASTVALTRADAKKLGLDPEALDYVWTIRTAGGEVKGASVVIGRIKVGGVEVENVDAMVLRDGLAQSLLGMSFLGQLYSYEFKGDTLILRK